MKKQPDFKETYALQTLRSRIEYLQQHLQLIDASLSNSLRILKNRNNTNIARALGKNLDSHTELNHPPDKSNSERIINYSRAKNAELSLIELYNIFTEYLRNILGEMYKKEPQKIVNKIANDKKHNNLSFNEIVKLGGFENISKRIVDKIFRQLENERSTPKLLEEILKHTKIQLNKDLKNNALMYLEMRHLIVHNKGKADENFVKNYGGILQVKQGVKLPKKFYVLNDAIKCINKLCASIDGQLIKYSLANKREFKS